ncbi:hypothetical protein ACFWOB_35860 [Streptomyces sp. NPDC058420]
MTIADGFEAHRQRCSVRPTDLCLTRLTSARVRGGQCVGTWLSERECG